MATTIEDIKYEEMIDELLFHEVMKNEAKKQCIYIFVEGESEELVFQPLLKRCGIDFDTMGIVIANYNGVGNLKHAIRLLSKTLSHDRPIIVTYDDDHEGKKINKINTPLITYFKIPFRPIVTYNDGSLGGAFEESFPNDCFIEACFHSNVIGTDLSCKRNDFCRIFDTSKPWLSQLAQFLSLNGGRPDSINKIKLAENMMHFASEIPETYKELAKIIINIRTENPVKHPEDILLNL
ncbi:TOPRIM nucleotidyl transferase/hydrolase domain-containing protein [Enterobacter cloacae]|uniref:TOPRIM nucleotidyl transferase/hydrolase domain-containing protein n=1 Tax=Enterobacter cloacae TaxID=550 RepID=UPI00216AF6B5|nr:TOPRIM nucleotidyl transferase/hydrolase domain-containing protein [Enterobacter cloacae]